MSQEASRIVQYYIFRKNDQLFYLNHKGQDIIFRNGIPIEKTALMESILHMMYQSMQESGAPLAMLHFLTHAASLMIQEEFNVRQSEPNVSGPTIPYAQGRVEVGKREFVTNLRRMPGGPEGKIGWITGDLDYTVPFFYSLLINYVLSSGSHGIALKFPREEMDKFTWDESVYPPRNP
jgi:hypothetical protein